MFLLLPSFVSKGRDAHRPAWFGSRRNGTGRQKTVRKVVKKSMKKIKCGGADERGTVLISGTSLTSVLL